ncbi:hypothetical protein LOK49_LG04G00157 [Camellia lanceoleosa]|uniref:Uncharacterized protein n=1 Tax=Camellia lanceoleosa TaxID=1840588 RepID=A0ACC0HXG2_9ERIC|nr:hypothetical protein LOK49_LG04G00157 [Camellia lanceoleosa]
MTEPAPSHSASPTKTQEEEDHLVRSTKKIKSKEHLETMDTTDSSRLPTPSVPVPGPKEASTEGQKIKSFKKALAAPQNADFYFDDSMDSLSADEDEDEGAASIHEDSSHPTQLDYRKELCKYQAAHPKSQSGHWQEPLQEGSPPTVEGTQVQTPMTNPNANDHLHQPAVVGDDTHGPWMMVTKHTRKPVINRKTQSTGPSPTHNKFSKLSKETQQDVEVDRGKKTTRLGLEKEASSPLQRTPTGPSGSKTVLLAQTSNTDPLGTTLSPTQDSSINPLIVDLGHLPQAPNRIQTSQPIPDNPSTLETASPSPEIPMADPPSETPLLLTQPLPTSDLLPLGSEGFTTTKLRKPLDPGTIYGEGGGHRSGGAYLPDGESSLDSVVRTKDRSNSHRRYGMVDRVDTDTNRTKLKMQSRVSNPLCADGLHEIKGSRS